MKTAFADKWTATHFKTATRLRVIGCYDLRVERCQKWYWAIFWANTVSHPLVADQGDLGRDEDDLWDCKLIGSWPENAWIGCSRVDRDGDPDDVLQNAFGLPIFSRKLRSALDRRAIGGVQYLPVKIVHHDGVQIGGFGIANVLNCADALDRRLSKYDVFPNDYFLPQRRGQIRVIKKPVLMRRALIGFEIVRLAPYKAPIYVSERFVQAYEGTDCTGLSFDEVETSA